MEIEAIEIDAIETNGDRWEITMSWEPNSDRFGIIWHKMLSDFEFGDKGYLPRTFEDGMSFITVDDLPGCILNTVQVLVYGENRKVRGLLLDQVSRFPLLPNGNTLLGYIDVLKQFPGFECVGELVRTLGRSEDFLAGIPIHTNIVRVRPSIAA